MWGPSEEQPMAVKLAPGEECDLAEGDWKVNGMKARIWAESATKVWDTFKEKDFPVVTEKTDGEEGYLSQEMQTVSFVVR